MPLSKTDKAAIGAGVAAIALVLTAQLAVDPDPTVATGDFVGKEPAYPCPWQPPGVPPPTCLPDGGAAPMPQGSYLSDACAAKVCARAAVASEVGRPVGWRKGDAELKVITDQAAAEALP